MMMMMRRRRRRKSKVFTLHAVLLSSDNKGRVLQKPGFIVGIVTLLFGAKLSQGFNAGMSISCKEDCHITFQSKTVTRIRPFEICHQTVFATFEALHWERPIWEKSSTCCILKKRSRLGSKLTAQTDVSEQQQIQWLYLPKNRQTECFLFSPSKNCFFWKISVKLEWKSESVVKSQRKWDCARLCRLSHIEGWELRGELAHNTMHICAHLCAQHNAHNTMHVCAHLSQHFCVHMNIAQFAICNVQSAMHDANAHSTEKTVYLHSTFYTPHSLNCLRQCAMSEQTWEMWGKMNGGTIQYSTVLKLSHEVQFQILPSARFTSPSPLVTLGMGQVTWVKSFGSPHILD